MIEELKDEDLEKVAKAISIEKGIPYKDAEKYIKRHMRKYNYDKVVINLHNYTQELKKYLAKLMTPQQTNEEAALKVLETVVPHMTSIIQFTILPELRPTFLKALAANVAEKKDVDLEKEHDKMHKILGDKCPLEKNNKGD